MNLALHGFLLQVILSLLNFKHGFRLCSAGEPGYLDFDNLPETNFSCQGKVIGGYYADVEAGCQMFHVCTIGQKDEIMDIKFLCLNGTVFDQETRVCERVDEVDCSKSERFYNLNLELYGNNAVTLSLHEEEDDDDSTEPREEHQQQQQHLMTSARPSTTSTTTTTTSRPSQPSTTSASNVYQQHPTGYPQHYQPRPAFPSVQTSQSNTHYDDKNGGYHHQYIFHNDERNNNNQATSYQLFSNQGVSSTTPTPQVHQQVRYSSTASPQVIHSEPSTVTPLQYHVQSASSTIQTLLNSNSNNPALINPLFHNHGIASTTEQFNVHNNNPREIIEYQDDSEDEEEKREERRPLEPVQSTSKGKVSKLSISPVPQQENHQSPIQTKSSSQNSQQQRISINYLPTPSPIQTTISAFYPTQKPQKQKSNNNNNQQVTQHIHVPPPPAIPQLKPHQITINLPPPDIQRIVQNPSPLLPSQSRVIVTAKASVSDESGRPLNASQLITLPLPTIPSTYDDYKEGDESFDPFYRDVPKIRNDRRIVVSRRIETDNRNVRRKRSADYDESEGSEESYPSEEVIFNAEIKDIKDLKANLPIIKAILFGLPIPENAGSSSTENLNIENADVNNPNIASNTDNDSKKNVTYDDQEKTTISEDTKSLASQIEEQEGEEEYADVEIPDPTQSNERQNKTSETNTFTGAGFQRRISFNPIIVKHDSNDAEPKDTVQLFLRAVEGNNALSSNVNSTQIEFLSSLNDTIDMNNKTDKIRQELLQTRSSTNTNKNNRRTHQNEESIEEAEEYLPRRNTRINKPKSSRYYDEYDASESIELSSRQRSNRLRSRPKERPRLIYRDDYIDEDDLEDDEYDEIRVNRNRKTALRRGLQGRRVPYRNRNRNFDYEDDIEVDEKPRTRTKALTASSRSKGRTYVERTSDDRRRRPESERRKSGRRRPSISTEEVSTKNKTDTFSSQILEDPDSKSSKEIDSRAIIHEDKENVKYSLKNERDKPHQVSTKKRLNSLERDEEPPEEKTQVKDDYIDQRASHPDEYNESEEAGISEDYAEYLDLRDRIRRVGPGNRRNRNRFDDEFETVPRRKSARRDKSRKFTQEVKKDDDAIEEKIEYEDVESTTLAAEHDSKTTNRPMESTVSEEVTISQEYDDYSLIKTTSKIDDENTELPAYTKPATEDVSTEGVFKFTDELPQIEKKDDAQKTDQQKHKITITEEDYVDDNYEPESYTEPKIKEPLHSVLKSNEDNEKHVFTVNDEPKELNIANDNKTENISNSKSLSEEEYDDIYYDRLESTTVSLSTEEYDDLETTTDIILSSTTSQPVLTSTEVPALSSKIKMTTSTSKTISTTTTTPEPTTTTTTPEPTTTTTTTEPTTTTTTTTTTPSTTTTTSTTTPVPTTIGTSTSTRMKSTAKFFKPLSFRKNYVYSPPSTTPNAVIIRRGPLAGPKPTKPSPSFNELAAKPLIRRLPLLSRTTTTTSEATLLEEAIIAELSKHLAEESNKHFEENNNAASTESHLPFSSTETVDASSVSKLSPTIKLRNNEVTTEDFDSTTINLTPEEEISTVSTKPNQTVQLKDQSFDNEVPKVRSDLNDSNNVPQRSEDSVAETSKSESESTTFGKLESTTNKEDSNMKLLDIKTTTTRTVRPSERRKLELTSVKSQIQKSNQGPKQTAGFNCLEKEMYRFYGDVRDCRLFHYCSPGFTARQVLDFRFVCEEGTIFDEESQSCQHDVPNPKCVKRTW